MVKDYLIVTLPEKTHLWETNKNGNSGCLCLCFRVNGTGRVWIWSAVSMALWFVWFETELVKSVAIIKAGVFIQSLISINTVAV